jgi:predicted N-acetyltransferase YhbS
VRHRRSGFECGVPTLNDFLEQQANQQQKRNNSTTHVLITETLEDGLHPIIGFVTLTASEIVPTGNKHTVKVQLIGQLAVHVQHQHNRLGQFLLFYALKCCWEIAQLSSCAAVIVDASNEDVKPFYLRYGFEALKDRPLRLYLPIKAVGELLAEGASQPGRSGAEGVP